MIISYVYWLIGQIRHNLKSVSKRSNFYTGVSFISIHADPKPSYHNAYYYTIYRLQPF